MHAQTQYSRAAILPLKCVQYDVGNMIKHEGTQAHPSKRDDGPKVKPGNAHEAITPNDWDAGSSQESQSKARLLYTDIRSCSAPAVSKASMRKGQAEDC